MLEAELDRISSYSKRNIKVENLACLITKENLEEIHRKMDGKKAVGVDHVSKAEYNERLQTNLNTLIKRMKNQSYYPQPCRRVYIEKPERISMLSALSPIDATYVRYSAAEL